MRKYDKQKLKKASNSTNESISSEAVPLLEGNLSEEELPVVSPAMKFLKYMSNNEAAELEKQIILLNKPKYLINPARVSKKLSPEEIICLTSETSKDGIRHVALYNHHIVLRAHTPEEDFEVLSSLAAKS
ncbi:unnamed protein product, partial [Rotaria sordida]